MSLIERDITSVTGEPTPTFAARQSCQRGNEQRRNAAAPVSSRRQAMQRWTSGA
jgi:hypothetical protein